MASAVRPLVVGTRGSALARIQTDLVLTSLRRHHPDIALVVRVFRTEGDRTQSQNIPLATLAGRGVFVKELELALAAGAIDMAIHSLKDITTAVEPGLTIAAVSEREDPRDVLVAREVQTLSQLPEGARVGSSSPRRAAQLAVLRPDLRFEPIRGNVDTRIRKVDDGEYDAAVLAAAGLIRLGLAHRVTEYFSPDLCLPDPGQGALAVEVRADDTEVVALLSVIDHAATRAAVTAERALLEAMGGGCEVPIGAFGEAANDRLRLRGVIARPDGRLLHASAEGDLADPNGLGRRVAKALAGQGSTDS